MTSHRQRIALVLGSLTLLNVAAIVVLAVTSYLSPEVKIVHNMAENVESLFGVGMIAYVLGLRHACDADHIAAIDNVSRRLALLQRDSLFVGGYFALGHSTIVCIMCVVVAVSATSASAAIDMAGNVAGIIGASVSFTFLSIITIANVYALVKLWLHRKQQLRGDGEAVAINADAGDDDGPANGPDRRFDVGAAPMGGCLTRCCPRLLRSVDSAPKMYVVGFVFGLGFDTSSEISLLAISVVTSMQHGGSPWFAILLAFLFTSAMTLVDTIDGILVRWAFDSVDADRRLLFNIGITAMAAMMAVVAAVVQLFSLIADLRPDDKSAFLEFWRELDTSNLGFVFIGLFAAALVVLFLLDCRARRRKAKAAASEQV